MLELYRAGLRIRREQLTGSQELNWLPAPAGVLDFDRGGVRCIANLSPAPVPLPPGLSVLLASGPLQAGALPPDSTAWLR
jgi:alpha-glucosidase